MGTNSNIAWCHHTMNFWRGCTKVSEGCRNCYMFRDQIRYGNDPSVVVRTGKGIWHQPFAKGKKEWKPGDRIFVNSWSDFFHKDADEWRDDAWDVIRKRPDLIWQILTKRPENMKDRMPKDWGNGWPNVWIGVSVENLNTLWRLDQLVNIPSAIRFISFEPILGPIFINKNILSKFSWAIIGGESGPNARPMSSTWAREIKNQCDQNNVKFFFKQGSENNWPDFNNFDSFPKELQVREFPNVNEYV